MEQIDVRILDRDYRLAVNAESRDKLLEAARMVDEKMRSVRDGGRVAGVDRIAVMAALQLAHDLIDARNPPDAPNTVEIIRRIKKMTDDVDDELKRQESLF